MSLERRSFKINDQSVSGVSTQYSGEIDSNFESVPQVRTRFFLCKPITCSIDCTEELWLKPLLTRRNENRTLESR